MEGNKSALKPLQQQVQYTAIRAAALEAVSKDPKIFFVAHTVFLKLLFIIILLIFYLF